MSSGSLRALLVSDFNVDTLAGVLRNDDASPALEVETAPFGLVVPVLEDASHPCWRESPDVALVWTQPQNVIPSFRARLEGESVPDDAILGEVRDYAASLARLGERVRHAFVPTWLRPPRQRGNAMLEMRRGIGIAETLMQMNLELSRALADEPKLWLLDAARWLELTGAGGWSPKLWYLSKVPFTNAVFRHASADLKAALRGLGGGARKLVIVDLDDTLWGGIVGDVGWQELKLGGHDGVGEAFADFQRSLRALSRRGILLGIVSKNTEAVALEAIDRHPEMLLRSGDFAGHRINWNDKAQNVADLVAELNLGLDSAVFIDDNPVERARVREALPEVFVPEWPRSPMAYRDALLELDVFDTPSITAEDRERARMYASEGRRRELAKQVASPEQWLESLDIRVEVAPLAEENLQRAAQLLNKTNQMNLATRRMPADALLAWARGEGRQMWTFRVADKFGDSGLTGLLGMEREGADARIVDFVLSCRVMGRKVEEAMLHTAVRHARSVSAENVRASFVPTERNGPCLAFWEGSGFNADEEKTHFSWRCTRDYPCPDALELHQPDADT